MACPPSSDSVCANGRAPDRRGASSGGDRSGCEAADQDLQELHGAHKTYEGGVARAGVTHNTVNGKKKPFTVKPSFSTALDNADKKMDRDKDGIACEKG